MKRPAAVLVILAISAPAATLACPLFCGDKPPATPWDLAPCDEYNFNDALIESARQGDRSAIDLLEKRYASTFTVAERIRIASALLGRVRDDSAIWNDLLPYAEHAVDFDEEKYAAYCAEHGYDKDRYEMMAVNALIAVSHDCRARPLLLRALATPLFEIGRSGLARFKEDEPP